CRHCWAPLIVSRPKVRPLAISPRGRRPDDDGLAGVEHRCGAAGELFGPPILAAHRVLADLARAAAGEPERGHAPVAGKNRAVHFFQKADAAAHAVTRIPLPAPAGARADVE